MEIEIKIDYNLKERCEIIQLAIIASQELNANQLIKWFENHIEQKQKNNILNNVQSIEEFYEATKV
ncbi:MAG: hypothetical protein ABJL44_18030 [Algibacter sp.]